MKLYSNLLVLNFGTKRTGNVPYLLSSQRATRDCLGCKGCTI